MSTLVLFNKLMHSNNNGFNMKLQLLSCKALLKVSTPLLRELHKLSKLKELLLKEDLSKTLAFWQDFSTQTPLAMPLLCSTATRHCNKLNHGHIGIQWVMKPINVKLNQDALLFGKELQNHIDNLFKRNSEEELKLLEEHSTKSTEKLWKKAINNLLLTSNKLDKLFKTSLARPDPKWSDGVATLHALTSALPASKLIQPAKFATAQRALLLSQLSEVVLFN